MLLFGFGLRQAGSADFIFFHHASFDEQVNALVTLENVSADFNFAGTFKTGVLAHFLGAFVKSGM